MFDDEITVEMLYIKERRKTMLAKFERKYFFENPFTFEMVFGAAMTYALLLSYSMTFGRKLCNGLGTHISIISSFLESV